MKKVLIVLALVGIFAVSGCAGTQKGPVGKTSISAEEELSSLRQKIQELEVELRVEKELAKARSVSPTRKSEQEKSHNDEPRGPRGGTLPPGLPF
jgi:hypothetical protein